MGFRKKNKMYLLKYRGTNENEDEHEEEPVSYERPTTRKSLAAVPPSSNPTPATPSPPINDVKTDDVCPPPAKKPRNAGSDPLASQGEIIKANIAGDQLPKRSTRSKDFTRSKGVIKQQENSSPGTTFAKGAKTVTGSNAQPRTPEQQQTKRPRTLQTHQASARPIRSSKLHTSNIKSNENTKAQQTNKSDKPNKKQPKYNPFQHTSSPGKKQKVRGAQVPKDSARYSTSRSQHTIAKSRILGSVRVVDGDMRKVMSQQDVLLGRMEQQNAYLRTIASELKEIKRILCVAHLVECVDDPN